MNDAKPDVASLPAKLLPCPGCAGDCTRVIGGPGTKGGPKFWAGCDFCHWRTWGDTEADAVAAWNRRALAKPASGDGLRGEQIIATPEQPGSSVQGEGSVSESAAAIREAFASGQQPKPGDMSKVFGDPRQSVSICTTPPPAPAAEQGELTITTDESGRCVAITRQDAEHRITETIWVATPIQPEARGVEGMVLVPKELAERVMDALVRFTGDEGWTMPDMDVADALGAILTTPNPVRAEQPEGKGAVLEELRMMSALTGEVAMAYYYQHPDGRQRGPYMLPNTGGGNLEACGYEQVLLYTRPAAPGVRVDERDNDDLDDAAFATALTAALAPDGGEGE